MSCNHALQYSHQGWGLLSDIHVKFHVSWQGFSNMAYDWLAAVLTNMDFNREIS